MGAFALWRRVKEHFGSGPSYFALSGEVTKTLPGALRPGPPLTDMLSETPVLSFGIDKGLCKDESVQPQSSLPLIRCLKQFPART